MKKISLTLLLFISAFGIFSQKRNTINNNRYANEWVKVLEFENQSLPQSAAAEVDKILRMAVEDENSPQIIKALIYQGKYELVIDEQNDTVIFRNLNNMVKKSDDAVERAVLHSMLGELYMQYYQKDQWQIRQRTELQGYIPSDMKEWTRNIFYDRVVEHMNASLAEQEQLEKAKVSTYAAVVDEGKDSRSFYPTMYDFLARRAIKQYRQMIQDKDLSRTLAVKKIAPESLFAPAGNYVHLSFNPQQGEYNLMLFECYRKHLASLLERDMSRSVLLTELDKLESLSSLQPAYGTNALPSLEAMLKKWEGDPFSVEVIDRIAILRRMDIYSTAVKNKTVSEEKTKELYLFLQQAIERFSDYERIALLENRLGQLTSSYFTVKGNNSFPREGEKVIGVTFKNIRSLTARLYRIDSPVDVQMHQSGVRQTIDKKSTFVKEIPVRLPDTPPYLEGEATIELVLQEAGSYMLLFDSQPETNMKNQPTLFFAVTQLAVFNRTADKDLHHFFVVDRVTGRPVAGAEVLLYHLPGNWRDSHLTEQARVTTNSDGLAVYKSDDSEHNLFYHAIKGDDDGSLLGRISSSHYFTANNAHHNNELITLFTDRSLYRPGQTLFYKGVLTREADSKRSLASGSKTEVSLHDANGEKIASQTAVTNDYGSIAGEFVLPQGLLPGTFSLQNDAGSVSFRVEEYKRPTYEVTFDTVKGSYRFGEEVTLKGKAVAYSGVPLQGAAVTYHITRQQSWWRVWGSVAEQFATGVVTSDDQGGFEIRFTPEKSDTEQGRGAAFTFTTEATVTDLNGETQTGSYSLSVGDVSMMLQLEMEERWDKERSDPILISAKNLSGSDVKAAGSYIVYSLDENDSIRKEVGRGNFETGPQPQLKKELSRLRSGKYRVKLSSRDDRANPVEAVKDLIIYSFGDKRPPMKTNDWFVVRSNTFTAGKPAELLLGATDRVHLLYELWKENQLLERQWLTLDNENKRFTLPYREAYGEGVTLMLTHVKDEQFYSHHIDLLRKEEKKELKVKLDIFRDRIRPGGNEEWRVTVTDEKGNPAAAELLASMYDFSLDRIYPSQPWVLPTASSTRYRSAAPFSRDYSFNTSHGMGNAAHPWKSVPPFRFDSFNWHGFAFSNHQFFIRGIMAGTRAQSLSESVVVAFGASKKEDVAGSAVAADIVEEDAMLPGSIEFNAVPAPEKKSTPQVRNNFSETAFFYPQLRTNERGETQIAFTVPESNTRWRFRLLAHDRELSSGSAEAFTISQKELMVTPNMPRFLRHGDRTTIATKISNLSDSSVSGEVQLEFFNPLTEEVVHHIPLSDQVQAFSLDKDASSEASWSFDVPKDIDLLGLRIIATTEAFSDGEQHALAVLPNRMLVTESMRMDLNGAETKEFTMERLQNRSSATIEDYRLTLEFASNPAWYAVQALPVLSEPVSDNAVAWFASYYANSLGAHIGKTYPKVAAMVEAWKKQGGSRETFLSNLEKNRELKNILLEETPWVLEAKSESEQKERLSLLFDLNRSRNQITAALARLKELQTTQGGWSWFKGFRPSVSITQYILFGFGQLKALGVEEFNDELLPMQSAALSFIDAEAIRRFDALKKRNKEWKKSKSIPLTDLEYLYVRTAYPDHPLDNSGKEMVNFYLSVIEKNWTRFGLYERSLIAILMQREGKTGMLQDMLNSFREHASISDEMGMYWANNGAHLFMSQSAVSVHTFIMDAFLAGGPKPGEIDNMKRWLLKQKQTQLWESTHATMDAVYALLSSGSDWFTAKGETTVTLGSLTVEPDSREEGTGYFKESWSRSEILPEMGRVSVTQKGNTPAWGALYWQYYEEMGRITATNASLDVEKLLFVEQNSASGPELVRITEEHPLRVGDKVIVRLTVRADRDLEFVHLKDMRAVAFEPTEQLSGMRWQNGVPYYHTSKDASTSFYFDFLPRGTWLFEYAVYVNRKGSYSNGISTIQCIYAPEFSSHTEGMRINVKE